ncbi:Imm7 family immunity protein [Paenibacillus polygoni]|uniref:Imm7 family immunity protein n=1 Tax=Paenibacillus polygoni TaxID=3050112 RepID=A0ABY8X2Q5_9BACL|nr:Imm7 family immunity protein [Paenibacillus polygoni]WIV19802.1 Imm7 family immunity protein [Paenibacillus polygoni]
MYQYHGWAVILESTGDEVSNEKEIKIVEAIKKYIEDLQLNVDVLDMKAVNGQYHLWMTGLWNREPSLKFSPVEIMKDIGIIAPGSYGMLYVFNDEHPKHFNEFRVYALARGNVEEKGDPFLSPLIPVVTDDIEAADTE